MADRMCAEIWIGGRVPAKLGPALVKAIREEDMSLDWGNSAFVPQTVEDLDQAKDDEGYLHFCDVDASYGQFGDLEAFLVTHKIPFERRSEGKYEHSPEVVQYLPKYKGPISWYATQNGEMLVEREEVAKALRSLERGYHYVAMKKLRRLIGPEIQLPPFEIVKE